MTASRQPLTSRLTTFITPDGMSPRSTRIWTISHLKDSGDNPVTPDLLGVIAPPMSGDFDEEPAFDPEANIVTIAKGDFPIEIDMHVHSADDHDLGKVVTVSPNHVMIEKGHIFKQDFSIPKSAVREVRDGKVYLNVPKRPSIARVGKTIPNPKCCAAQRCPSTRVSITNSRE